ncbi:hypothetical protein ERJ75_001698400 [Trypanosoma vivax]|nr:hypothetical protein ERJ75_001698400 [Trypanosoma vivax]
MARGGLVTKGVRKRGSGAEGHLIGEGKESEGRMRRGLREVKGQCGQVESTAQVLLLEATRTGDSRQEERAAPAPLFREVKGLWVDTECDLVGRESQRTGHLGSRDASDTKGGD